MERVAPAARTDTSIRAPAFDDLDEDFEADAFGWDLMREPPSSVDAIRSDIAVLRERLAQAAPRRAVVEMDRAISLLARQMEDLRHSGEEGRAQDNAAVESELLKLKAALDQARAPERFQALAAGIDALTRKVDALAAKSIDPVELARLHRQTEEMKDLAARALAPGGLKDLAQRIATCAAQMERRSEEMTRRMGEATNAFERSTETLLAKVSQFESSYILGGQANAEELRREVSGEVKSINERLDRMTEKVAGLSPAASAEFAKRLDGLLARIESVGDVDKAAVAPLTAAVEKYLTRLTDRVRDTQTRLERLDTIETSLARILAEMERVREAAVSAPAEAAQAVAMKVSEAEGGPAVVGLKRGLAVLEARQDELERRAGLGAELDGEMHEIPTDLGRAAHDDSLWMPRAASDVGEAELWEEPAPAGFRPAPDPRADVRGPGATAHGASQADPLGGPRVAPKAARRGAPHAAARGDAVHGDAAFGGTASDDAASGGAPQGGPATHAGTAQDMPLGASRGGPQDAAQGEPHGASHAMPKGAGHGASHAMPRGAARGAPRVASPAESEGASHGASQGAPHEAPHVAPPGSEATPQPGGGAAPQASKSRPRRVRIEPDAELRAHRAEPEGTAAAEPPQPTRRVNWSVGRAGARTDRKITAGKRNGRRQAVLLMLLAGAAAALLMTTAVGLAFQQKPELFAGVAASFGRLQAQGASLLSFMSPVRDLPAPVGPQALRTAALSGDVAAAYAVGLRYADGVGTEVDKNAAESWLAYAVSKGSAPAAYRLGSLYEYTSRNLKEAKRFYEWAAEQGNVRAMHNLGVIYSQGIDGRPDWDKAIKWFRKSAEMGQTDSQYNLGVIYARGLAGKADAAEAWKWFALAASQGDADSASKRDSLIERADPRALDRAREEAASFKPMAYDMAANTVTMRPEWGMSVPEAMAGKATNSTKRAL